MQVSMPSAEHIDLQQAERVEIVLVPFDDGAVVHGGVADGHDFRQAARASARSRRHAGRGGAESRSAPASSSSTRASSGSGRIEPGLADMMLPAGSNCSGPRWWWRARRRYPRTGPAPCRPRARQPPAIADDGGGEAGAVAAVAGIDILDHLLAPLMLEIDVDVGRLLALGRDEALEQEIDLGRDRQW